MEARQLYGAQAEMAKPDELVLIIDIEWSDNRKNTVKRTLNEVSILERDMRHGKLFKVIRIIRVEHFVIFEKLVFAITSRMLRILTEHIVIKNSLDYKLQTFSICSVRILNILEVIGKTSFSKISKCSTQFLI